MDGSTASKGNQMTGTNKNVRHMVMCIENVKNRKGKQTSCAPWPSACAYKNREDQKEKSSRGETRVRARKKSSQKNAQVATATGVLRFC